MIRRRYIQIEDRRMSTLERRFQRGVYKAIVNQVKHYIENGFISDDLYNTLSELYRPVLEFYLNQQWQILQRDDLKKSFVGILSRDPKPGSYYPSGTKKQRFFLDTWGQWIDNYILTVVRERSFAIDGVTDKIIQRIFESARRGETIGSITNMLVAESKGTMARARARTIARTEVGEAVNVAKTKSSDDWEVSTGMRQGKLWIHRGAKVPREWHMELDNGKIIPKEDFWNVTDPNTGITDRMLYPHDSGASPGNVINCGCMVIYTRIEYQTED